MRFLRHSIAYRYLAGICYVFGEGYSVWFKNWGPSFMYNLYATWLFHESALMVRLYVDSGDYNRVNSKHTCVYAELSHSRNPKITRACEHTEKITREKWRIIKWLFPNYTLYCYRKACGTYYSLKHGTDCTYRKVGPHAPLAHMQAISLTFPHCSPQTGH